MLSLTLQIFTLLAVKAIHTPAVSSQDSTDFPNMAGLAQLGSLDKCGITCLMSAYTSVAQACPNMNDVACFCKNQSFMSTSQACMVSTCPTAFLSTAEAFAIKMCAAAGVTLPQLSPNPVPANPTPIAATSIPPIASPAPTAPTASPSPTGSPAPAAPTAPAASTIVPTTKVNINSTTESTAATIPVAALVPATSNPAAPISATTNGVSTPATNIVANTSAASNLTKSSATSSANKTSTKISNVNGTQQTKQPDESSGSVSLKATSILMTMTTVVALIVA